MKTQDLIALMANDPLPTPPARAWRMLAPLLPVWALVLALVLALWRLNPDLSRFASTEPFQFKLLWLLVLLWMGLWALWCLAHPGSKLPRALAVAMPLALAAMAWPAAAQSLASPAEQQAALWLGQSWGVCLASIGLLSLPLLAVLLWVLRRMAPTRPALAGAMAGLAAACLAAMAYSLHCTENSYGFYLLWYGGSLLALSALGAVLGPRWLRW